MTSTAPRRYSPAMRWLRHSCPSVGCLMDLCEENYGLLTRLAPGLERMQGCWRSRVEGGVDLQLQVLEQSRYTSLVRLTFLFPSDDGERSDPDAVLRVYHDATQAEILELHQNVLLLEQRFEHPSLEQKWKANLFVSKWLEYCLLQGHSFSRRQRDLEPA